MAKTHLASVVSANLVSKETRLLRLRYENEEPVQFTGGKFIIITTDQTAADGNPLKRTYSIVSVSSGGTVFELLVKLVGPGSDYMHRLQAGDSIQFSGPWGKFLPFNNTTDGDSDDSEDNTVNSTSLVIATDTGIAAALGLVSNSDFQKSLATSELLWLASDAKFAEWPELLVPKNLALHESNYVPEVGDVHRPQRVLTHFIASFNRCRPRFVYLVGDGNALAPMLKALDVLEFEREDIRTEFFFNNPDKSDSPNLRTGHTTGACAAAAARAATRLLLTGSVGSEIETVLPNGEPTSFLLYGQERSDTSARCSIIKDAGDDPDCTHSAQISAEVRLSAEPGVRVEGGKGVARVTKPGLGLEVGGPSITSPPRRNIEDMVGLELVESGHPDAHGIDVTISVQNGEKIALNTTNDRLGLIGGISILGSTGIVRPYSTSAFRASVLQQVDVAAQQGVKRTVFTTGGKTEAYAMKLFPDLDPVAFIQVGDFIGAGISRCVVNGVPYPTVVGMVGKMSKMGDGKTMTHVAGSKVNMEYLAGLTAEVGAPEELVENVRNANTARHFLDMCREAGFENVVNLICRDVVRKLTEFAKNKVSVEAYMIDSDGVLIGKYSEENNDS